MLGIDLGKNVCSVVGLDSSGAVVLRRRVRRDFHREAQINMRMGDLLMQVEIAPRAFVQAVARTPKQSSERTACRRGLSLARGTSISIRPKLPSSDRDRWPWRWPLAPPAPSASRSSLRTASTARPRLCHVELAFHHGMDEFANAIAQASFDRIKPVIEKMDRRVGLRPFKLHGKFVMAWSTSASISARKLLPRYVRDDRWLKRA